MFLFVVNVIWDIVYLGIFYVLLNINTNFIFNTAALSYWKTEIEGALGGTLTGVTRLLLG